MKRARSHEAELKISLKDPVRAADYLRVASEDPDRRVFLLALKDVIDARDGVAEIAKAAKLDRRHLYVMLSDKGNPEWESLSRLLDVLGIRISFAAKDHKLAA
jgi:probable addiction module antidote protein